MKETDGAGVKSPYRQGGRLYKKIEGPLKKNSNNGEKGSQETLTGQAVPLRS